MNYAAICAIAKDETQYIEEWVQYHALLGFEAFYIYDHGSKVPLSETLGAYYDEDFLTIIEVEGKHPQQQAYQHCLDKFGADCRWIAFIDIDEFICLKQDSCIQSFLLDYDEFAGVALNWALFGTNGCINPPELVTKAQTMRHDKYFHNHCIIKSIVQPALTSEPSPNPHQFVYKDKGICVSENRFPVNGPNGPVSTDLIQLNHYYFRSQKTVQDKIARDEAWGRAQDYDYAEYVWKRFYDHFDTCTVRDDSMAEVVFKLETLRRKNNPALFKVLAREGSGQQEMFQYIDRATEFIANGNYDEALKLLAHSRIYFAENVYFLLFAAECYLGKKRYDAAMRFIHKALAERHDDKEYNFVLEAYPVLYNLYMAQGRGDEARSVLVYLKRVVSECRRFEMDVAPEIEAFVAAVSETD